MQFEIVSCLILTVRVYCSTDMYAVVLKGYQEENDCLGLQISETLH
jgi:hypothetical protein